MPKHVGGMSKAHRKQIEDAPNGQIGGGELERNNNNGNGSQ